MNKVTAYVSCWGYSTAAPVSSEWYIWSAVLLTAEQEAMVEKITKQLPEVEDGLMGWLIASRSDRTIQPYLQNLRNITSDLDIKLGNYTVSGESEEFPVDKVLDDVSSHLSSFGPPVEIVIGYNWVPFGYFVKYRTDFRIGDPSNPGLLVADFALWEYSWDQHRKLLLEFYGSRLDKFHKHLMEFPLLGSDHEVASELRAAIDWHSPRHLSKDVWFRARSVSGGRILTARKMGPPPSDRTPEGRYNHLGKPVMYLSADEDTCCDETLDGKKGIMWIQQFVVRDKKVLDLTILPNSGQEYVLDSKMLLVAALMDRNEAHVDRDKQFKPEYYVTRYVADVVRSKGFDGILYDSVRGRGQNLVLFDYHEVRAKGKPCLIVHTKKVRVDVRDKSSVIRSSHR